MRYVFLLGRILFSSIFLVKSLEHFSSKMIEHAANEGVRMPHLFVPLAGVIALLGGLSILFGYKARLGAWLLVIFLIPITFVMHNFWNATDLFSYMMHHLCFFKNLSLLGACLMISYFGSGPLSLDSSHSLNAK